MPKSKPKNNTDNLCPSNSTRILVDSNPCDIWCYLNENIKKNKKHIIENIIDYIRDYSYINIIQRTVDIINELNTKTEKKTTSNTTSNTSNVSNTSSASSSIQQEIDISIAYIVDTYRIVENIAPRMLDEFNNLIQKINHEEYKKTILSCIKDNKSCIPDDRPFNKYETIMKLGNLNTMYLIKLAENVHINRNIYIILLYSIIEYNPCKLINYDCKNINDDHILFLYVFINEITYILAFIDANISYIIDFIYDKSSQNDKKDIKEDIKKDVTITTIYLRNLNNQMKELCNEFKKTDVLYKNYKIHTDTHNTHNTHNTDNTDKKCQYIKYYMDINYIRTYWICLRDIKYDNIINPLNPNPIPNIKSNSNTNNASNSNSNSIANSNSSGKSSVFNPILNANKTLFDYFYDNFYAFYNEDISKMHDNKYDQQTYNDYLKILKLISLFDPNVLISISSLSPYNNMLLTELYKLNTRFTTLNILLRKYIKEIINNEVKMHNLTTLPTKHNNDIFMVEAIDKLTNYMILLQRYITSKCDESINKCNVFEDLFKNLDVTPILDDLEKMHLILSTEFTSTRVFYEKNSILNILYTFITSGKSIKQNILERYQNITQLMKLPELPNKALSYIFGKIILTEKNDDDIQYSILAFVLYKYLNDNKNNTELHSLLFNKLQLDTKTDISVIIKNCAKYFYNLHGYKKPKKL